MPDQLPAEQCPGPPSTSVSSLALVEDDPVTEPAAEPEPQPASRDEPLSESFTVVKRCMVRAEYDTCSAEVGLMEVGTVFVALESRTDDDGW